MTNPLPKRRPGRPTTVDRDALLRRGITLFVHHPHHVRPGLKVASVARMLEVSASTFSDKFGQSAADGRPSRRAPVEGFFSALRDRVLAGDGGVEPRRVQQFLQRYGCVFAGGSDTEIRRRLQGIPAASPAATVAEIGRAAAGLGSVPNDADRAVLALDVLSVARGLPVEIVPGKLAEAELTAIDAFSVATGGRWPWWRLYRFAGRLPALHENRPLHTVVGLRAESRARHGAGLGDILRCADGFGATPKAQADLEITVKLAAARGYADAGRLAEGIAALPDAPSADMLLITVARLWHRAVIEDDDVVVAELQRRARERFDWWTDHVAAAEGDGPDFEDGGADEARALAANGDERRAVLSTLVSEQLTSEYWRDGSGAWSLPETVEVVVYHLNAAGRYGPASELVADLLMAVGWDGALPRSLPAGDRAAAERLIAAHPEAGDRAVGTRAETMRTSPVDTRVLSSRRVRHGSTELPTGNFGRLLDAVIAGDVDLDHSDADAIRQLGWVLDQRAARFR